MNRLDDWRMAITRGGCTRFAAILALLAVPSFLRSQTLVGSVKIKAAAKVQALTKDDATPRLHWILLSMPDPADVDFANPDAAALVKQGIKDLAANPGECTQWALEDKIKCSFPAALKNQLKSISLVQASMRNAPAAPGQTPEPTIRFQYQPRARPNATIDSLTVKVTTDLFDATPSDAGAGSPMTLTWQAASSLLGRDNPPSAGAAIPITVQFTTKDRQAPLDIIVLQKAFAEVAVTVLEKARDENFLPGAPAPGNAAMTLLSNDLENTLAPSIPGWPAPLVRFVVRPGTGDYALEIKRIRVVSGAKVEIGRGQIQGASGMVDFVGSNAVVEKRIQDTLAAAAVDAERKLQPQINDMIGHLPSATRVDAARNALRSNPLISGNVDVRADSSQLIFSGTRRWAIGSLNVKAALAGSLTPEDFVTGQASLDASNLLRNITHISLGETYNLSIQGGPEVQRATLDFAIPRTRGTTWLLNYGFRHSLYYTRDWNQRFGNNLPADAKLINRQQGMTPALFAEISRPPDDNFHWIFSSRIEASYDWRSVHIEPRLAGAPDLLNGQLSAPTLEFRQLAGHDSKGFVGVTRLQLTALARRGTHALAGDYAFEQFTASAGGEVFFGPKRNSDYFLRYQRGLGYSGKGTHFLS